MEVGWRNYLCGNYFLLGTTCRRHGYKYSLTMGSGSLPRPVLNGSLFTFFFFRYGIKQIWHLLSFHIKDNIAWYQVQYLYNIVGYSLVPVAICIPYSLRLSNCLLYSITLVIIVPRVRTVRYGERSFAFAAPRLWNGLEHHVHDSTTIHIFKKSLKTILFKRAYDVWTSLCTALWAC